MRGTHIFFEQTFQGITLNIFFLLFQHVILQALSIVLMKQRNPNEKVKKINPFGWQRIQLHAEFTTVIYA